MNPMLLEVVDSIQRATASVPVGYSGGCPPGGHPDHEPCPSNWGPCQVLAASSSRAAGGSLHSLHAVRVQLWISRAHETMRSPGLGCPRGPVPGLPRSCWHRGPSAMEPNAYEFAWSRSFTTKSFANPLSHVAEVLKPQNVPAYTVSSYPASGPSWGASL